MVNFFNSSYWNSPHYPLCFACFSDIVIAHISDCLPCFLINYTHGFYTVTLHEFVLEKFDGSADQCGFLHPPVWNLPQVLKPHACYQWLDGAPTSESILPPSGGSSGKKFSMPTARPITRQSPLLKHVVSFWRFVYMIVKDDAKHLISA